MVKNYSYEMSQRKRKIGRVVGKVKTFHLKYQNIILLLLSFVFTYYLVKTGIVINAVSLFGQFGYVGAFVLGFLFSFGFTTTPAATALFFLARHVNPVTMAFIAAIGSAISNVTIYYFVRYRLLDEIRYVISENLKIEVSRFEILLTHQVMRSRWMKVFVPALAGILTAMPVPTELVAAILWNVVRYNPKIVAIYSFIFSFIGILALGLFGFHLA